MTVRNAIVKILSQSPPLTAGECLAHLMQANHAVSRQAVHKALKALVEEEIIIKLGLRYTLNLSWIVETIETTRVAYKNYLDRAAGDFLTIEAHGSKKWAFNDFQSADDFWLQVMILLLGSQGGRTVVQWHPSVWFLLLGSSREDRFQRALKAQGGRMVWALPRVTSPLDERLLDLFKPRDVRIVRTRRLADSTTHATLVGDSLVLTKLSVGAGRCLDALVKDPSELARARAVILSRQERIVFRLEPERRHRRLADALARASKALS